MIIVNKGKCGGCGLCARICHESCISLVHSTAVVNHEVCSTCAQCIAACPLQALSWNGAEPLAYESACLPSTGQVIELLLQRRTMRRFKNEPLDRDSLQEIVDHGIYAPTNNYHLRAIIVDDKILMAKLDQVMVGFSARIYNLFYRPRLLSSALKTVWPNDDYVQTEPKLLHTIERGRTFDHNAAAMVFIAGDRRTPLSEASAAYALYNMILYAQTKGIGSCLWGPGQIFLTRNGGARKLLGVRKEERIYGTVILGHPANRFQNKVQGKRLPTHWNGSI